MGLLEEACNKMYKAAKEWRVSNYKKLGNVWDFILKYNHNNKNNNKKNNKWINIEQIKLVN